MAAQPSDVNALKAQLNQKLADLKTKHDEALKKINTDAQTKINALKKQLSDKESAANKPILDQIAKIKADLAKKQADLDNQLAELKTKDAADYQALHDKLFPKNTDVAHGESDHITTGGQEIVLPGNGNGASAATNTNNSMIGTDVQSVAYPTREQYRENQLPQTGNRNSMALVALGAMVSMLGFGLAAKKRY